MSDGRRGIRIGWPHRAALSHATISALLLGAVLLTFLVGGAYLDGTLDLPGSAIGLFENPGMFSIVAGDVALIIICTAASQMSYRMGRKLPSRRPALTRRYYRVWVNRRIFGRGGAFYKIFALLSVIGILATINQTVQMFDSVRYYGHPTFGDWGHYYSFAAVRLNLIVSWCIIIPLFFTYLICHAISIRGFLRVVRRHQLDYFDERHPDRCGGYSLFGWIDTLFALGIFVVLMEVVLLIISHERVTLGNVFAICALVIGALLMSIFSVGETLRLVRRQERSLKSKSYAASRRTPAPISTDSAVLNFGLSFSPYTTTAFKLAVGLRALIAAPAVLRIIQYANAAA